jgi:hypothetical protein
MGRLSEATFFYGIDISDEDLTAFRSALASHDKLGDLDSKTPLNASDISLNELCEAVQVWLDASGHLFNADSNFDEDDEGDPQIVLRYKIKGGEDGGCSVGKPGYEACTCQLFRDLANLC